VRVMVAGLNERLEKGAGAGIAGTDG
jgi:hypothetical protein